MWNTPLQAFVVSIVLAASLSLSGCDSNKEDTISENPGETLVEETPAVDSPSSDADLDGATTKQGTKVVYDVSAWGSDKVKPLDVNEIDGIRSTFGRVVSTDKNSLDYASNPASKYRFMKADAPYLDLIDSEKYLELGWYYANPTDSDSEKQVSVEHAKKSYLLSKQLMGAEGGKMLEEVLAGQIVKNKTIGGQKVELAKCEFYSCMLVLNKSVTPAEES